MAQWLSARRASCVLAWHLRQGRTNLSIWLKAFSPMPKSAANFLCVMSCFLRRQATFWTRLCVSIQSTWPSAAACCDSVLMGWFGDDAVCLGSVSSDSSQLRYSQSLSLDRESSLATCLSWSSRCLLIELSLVCSWKVENDWKFMFLFFTLSEQIN